MSNVDPLDLFLPAVRTWFRETLGEPTPAQHQGWPAIAGGSHTLILAPTGSGKTLAAFLACLDRLWRQSDVGRGVKVLYISPLKALNNDIHRNLQAPLEGVAQVAQRLGQTLPALDAAVRTGDTPQSERQRLLRRPPHILITTPESLHILLTSRARETLRGVTHVIVDEIHALCSNKRGVFLSLLLERLEALRSPNTASFVRIGLSATQRPLDEVARFLGGQLLDESGQFRPRPVTIVDAGLRKDLDLGVLSPVEQFGPLPEGSIWPSIYRLLTEQIRAHRSTIIFANDRRSVERITSFINDEEDLVRAHHGSVDLERRQEIEAALKEGRLPAVCATASLEMGIDMGSVDLVCQVASPGNVARALQRVGRAGHLVGQKSKGRFIPRTQADLLEQAVLVQQMRAGLVEAIRVPKNCLDILAQQIVACTAMEDCSVEDLFALVRQAYPYRDLTAQAFETTLEMITGRYRFMDVEGVRSGSLEALQARISWDRVHNRLIALPGSKQIALVNGGTIPDTGQYAAYTASGVRIGELDEEFIYERRVGDTFLLGTSAWRLDKIDADRVIVAPAEGQPAMVPFWRGEGGGRSHDLGVATGAFLRELLTRLDRTDCLDWLMAEHGLNRNAARSLHYHVRRQFLAAGCLPTDRTILVEASRDPLGDWQVVLLSPLGQRLHLALRLALESVLRRRLGYQPQCLHHDDGVLIRLTDSDEPILDLFMGLTPENLEGLILEELADSALFALRFRHNAARALLMPRGQAGKRAPLWLQRLRGKDLLQVARRHADFPVVVETFRECLNDHLDVPRLAALLRDIQAGVVEVKTRRAEMPSPFAAGLLFGFTAANLYALDHVEKDGTGARGLDTDLLGQLLGSGEVDHLLDPRAVYQVERRLRGLGQPPRSAAEMAEWLRRLGDLSPGELEGPMMALLEQLVADGRARKIALPGTKEPERWVLSEEAQTYHVAFNVRAATVRERGLAESDDSLAPPPEIQSAASLIFARYLDTHALVGLEDVLARYPFERSWAQRQLESWVRSGRAVLVPGGAGKVQQYAIPGNLDQVQRTSLGLLRREVITCPPAQFIELVLRHQHLAPGEQRAGSDGVAEVLDRMSGLALPAHLWEESVLPARISGYQPRGLDAWIAGGTGVWVGQGRGAPGLDEVAFLPRSALPHLSLPGAAEAPPIGEEAEKVQSMLQARGASFLTDLACDTGMSPAAVRSALWELARQRRVTNDQFDVVRRGEEVDPLGDGKRGPSLRSLRRRASQKEEGRWSLLRWGQATPEELALSQCLMLLNRYGVVARELALLDEQLLPWRVLFEVFSKLELTGEVRRGYFVEGLSGAQFATPEATQLLQDLHAPAVPNAPLVLLHSQDPANLYGAGAPFDIPLLDGGTRSFSRRAGNWLVLKCGKPILLAEQHGKKLTALSSAAENDVIEAVKLLPRMFDHNKGLMARHKLTVDEWNGQPVTTSPGKAWLEAAGFVRDYQGMTLYAVWR